MVKEQNLPFTQIVIDENTVIRSFRADEPIASFKWHWDESDRILIVLNKNDWQIQFDDQLPKPLPIGHKLFIPKGEWHRIIKGSSILQVKIKEMK